MSLQSYIEKPISDLYSELGAFWAFSTKQFNESKIEGVQYENLFSGLVCPASKVIELLKRLDKMVENGIKQDLEENGKDKIIIRELYNYECFYTGHTEDAEEALKDYPITGEEIQDKFNEIRYSVY